MAEHGTVEYATATGNDLSAHEATYDGFVQLAFIGTFLVINVILGLAIGAVADHWFIAACVMIVSILIAMHGLAAGARAPIVVMTVLSLLALGLTA